MFGIRSDSVDQTIAEKNGIDLIRLQSDTEFSIEELRRLRLRFEKLDLDKNGKISVDELKALPEVGKNPLVDRIFEVMDTDKGGDIDFEEFIKVISVFIHGSVEEKLQFSFKMYDKDEDGFISCDELFDILVTMVGDNLNQHQLKQIVYKTMMHADTDEDGKISFDEFLAIVGESMVPSMRMGV